MAEQELMTDADIHAFGVEIVHNQLVEAGWTPDSVDIENDRAKVPQITAARDDEYAIFVVRTGLHPEPGRIEGEDTFRHFCRLAAEMKASCYFASVSIANSTAATDEEMSVPVKGVAYHVAFDGLVKMELPPEEAAAV
ncbi:MAG: hypothetical protein KF736_10475 [Acidobacteria bacterium]|nr:hypothetical protein [Acidobacteriota bacterium]MCW5949547.1 hypothetical protein [Pyrinomonadaceae bacterium]